MSKDDKVQKLYEEAHEHLASYDYAAALNIAKQLERLRHSSAYEIYALAYAGQGEMRKAIAVLEKGTALAPLSWLLWQLLGNYYSDEEEWVNAQAAYAQALTCPNVDASFVHYNIALALMREGKYDEAFAHIEQVTAQEPQELRMKAAAARIDILTSTGKAHDAIRYAEELLQGLTEEELDEDELDDRAAIVAAYAVALWKRGDVDRALEQAWKAIHRYKQQDQAAWLIREIENLRSPEAHTYKLMLKGRWPEPFEDDGVWYGFFTTYTVVADTVEEAFNLAIRFEAEEARGSLTVKESEVLGSNVAHPKGVYDITGYIFYPLGAQ